MKLKYYISVVALIVVIVTIFFVALKLASIMYSIISNFIFIILLIVVVTLLFLSYKLWKKIKAL